MRQRTFMNEPLLYYDVVILYLSELSLNLLNIVIVQEYF